MNDYVKEVAILHARMALVGLRSCHEHRREIEKMRKELERGGKCVVDDLAVVRALGFLPGQLADMLRTGDDVVANRHVNKPVEVTDAEIEQLCRMMDTAQHL